MRHHNSVRKFGRVRKVRKALLSSLARNLIAREKIKTTLPKAKELRPLVEKIITKAKKDDVATRRYVNSTLVPTARELKKIFEVLAPKYKDRKGGYTRIMKLGARVSDSAEMAIIEFV